MTLFRAGRSKPRYEPLIVEPVPEVPISELPEVLLTLRDYRRRHIHTYGAVILRGASPKEVEKCENFLTYLNPAFAPPGDSVMRSDAHLHTDRGPRNDITVHYTQTGSLEFMLLPEAHFKPRTVRVDGEERVAATAALFEHEQLDREVFEDGLIALRTSVGEGDLLLLDHTQPHATAHCSPDRVSLAYFAAS